ncbi:MAG TPA: preprotein translocase subunit SecE [Actinomycetota bacterium]
MQRQQRAGGERPSAPARRRQAVEQKKRERTGFRQFLREVRQELNKVNWPDRRQMLIYTTVVLVTVVVLTSFVFALDFVIGKGIFTVFGIE